MASKALISSSLPGVHDELCYYGYVYLLYQWQISQLYKEIKLEKL